MVWTPKMGQHIAMLSSWRHQWFGETAYLIFPMKNEKQELGTISNGLSTHDIESETMINNCYCSFK